MKITPKFDRVLIRREQLKSKDSLILIPEQVGRSNPTERGEVLAVGPLAGGYDKDGKLVDPITIGKKVIFARHAGAEIRVSDDEVYWVIQDTDIHCEYEEN